MNADFDTFRNEALRLQPRGVVVLGSGLGDVAEPLKTVAAVAYADIPGFVPASVAGHHGQLAVGIWGQTPMLVCFGRVHYYEGHPWDRVTRLIELSRELGAGTAILTNAAGGIHEALDPDGLMAIRAHLKLLTADAWKQWVSDSDPPLQQRIRSGRYLYSAHWLNRILHHEPGLPTGTYAAVTGPCYETPSEIRALRMMGADAVGMSTAMEAEKAMALGMNVMGISCITNKAAGLSEGVLNHKEVEQTARKAVPRMSRLLSLLIAEM